MKFNLPTSLRITTVILKSSPNWYLFAYFRPLSGVSPTRKKLYLGIKMMSN